MGRKMKFLESLAFASAVKGSKLHRDANANPGLDKSGARDRIDVLSAAVIAAGVSEPLFDRPAPRPQYRVTVV